MKKNYFLLEIFIIVSSSCFSITPKNYVEKNYGERAILFNEDTDDWLDQDTIDDSSPIYFYNSTDESVIFEFREIKTKFGNVTKDEVRSIKGRKTKIKIEPGQYIDTVLRLGDLEHIVFVFDEADKYEVYAYADRREKVDIAEGSSLYIDGSGGSSFSEYTNYSVIFEIALKE